RHVNASNKLGSQVDIYEGDLASANVTVDVLPLVDKAVLYAFARGVGAKTSVGYSRFRLVNYAAVKPQ
ncbi:MAG: hypothetical protein ACK4M3_07920, partial [Pyrobaculum sp.]